jgi:hypothetical protein
MLATEYERKYFEISGKNSQFLYDKHFTNKETGNIVTHYNPSLNLHISSSYHTKTRTHGMRYN